MNVCRMAWEFGKAERNGLDGSTGSRGNEELDIYIYI